MLKQLFGACRPDHPMANPKEARRILEALPPQELKALQELADWHESVSAAEGFKSADRVALLTALDEAAQPRVRKLSRDYFGAVRPSRFLENQLWTQLHQYWHQAGQAWARAMDGVLAAKGDAKMLAPVALRALRAMGQQIKWQHMRYGPIDAAVWGLLNKVYAAAEAHGIAEARNEFLRAAMFSASSPDGLLPLEIEIAERLVSELSGGFVVSKSPGRELLYWTDLAAAMAPLRATRAPQPAASVRFFGPGTAAAALQGLIQRIEKSREVPSDIKLGAPYEAEVVLEVMRHVAVYWSPEPPERKHARHAVKSRLAIAHGFAGMAEALGEAQTTLDFDKRGTESWIVDNVSAGGFGAIVPQLKGDWLRVGTLLAMQPDGGTNWIAGIVRRVNRTSNQEARVGIQTLSRAPSLARFALRDVGEQVGLLLPAAVLGSGEVSIALPANIYAQGMNLEAQIAGRQHVYMPLGVAERGEDYEIVRFREMIRES